MTIPSSSDTAFPVCAFGQAGKRLQEIFICSFQRKDLFANLPVDSTQSVLLTGPSGSGKRSLAVELCRQFGVTVDSARLSLEYPAQMSKGIETLCSSVTGDLPTAIIFQSIHDLFPARNTDEEAYHVFTVSMQGRQSHRKGRTLIIATTADLDGVNEAVKNSFEEHLSLELPTPTQRGELLKWLLRSPYNDPSFNVLQVADCCHAYTLADLATLCRRAVETARERIASSNLSNEPTPVTLRDSDFQQNMSSIKLAENRKRYDVSRMEAVRWTDVGGHSTVKRLLQESVVWFYQNTAAFARLGIQPSKGVLLYGPPGTGKTLLAKAVAFESGANFLPISISEIIKGEVGESEKAISRTFETARRCSPCIIFMDELEALFSRHDQMGQVGKKLFSQLVVEIDTLDWQSSRIVLLGATNHPNSLDPALLRPGRIDRLIAVRPPSASERGDILQTLASKLPFEKDLDWSGIAARTRGKTGADLKELVRRAGLAALNRTILDGQPTVQMCDFEDALRTPQFRQPS
ncbi:hypothetical protein SpCBS45565_g00776 [Spizellomyces sp. 'palustris']|nr:hypothetical protein SpCBS45565_g00776 [Spizellomyces sp. 'palustris']